jgi:hypothetical protein
LDETSACSMLGDPESQRRSGGSGCVVAADRCARGQRRHTVRLEWDRRVHASWDQMGRASAACRQINRRIPARGCGPINLFFPAFGRSQRTPTPGPHASAAWIMGSRSPASLKPNGNVTNPLSTGAVRERPGTLFAGGKRQSGVAAQGKTASMRPPCVHLRSLVSSLYARNGEGRGGILTTTC